MLEHIDAALAHSKAMQARHLKDEQAPLHIWAVNAELVRVSLMVRGLREAIATEDAAPRPTPKEDP